MSKYSNFINFLKDVGTPNVHSLNVNEKSDYSSYNTAVDLLSALSYVIDVNITKQLQDSPVITILTDESTDFVVHHKVCISARVVDPLTLKPST